MVRGWRWRRLVQVVGFMNLCTAVSCASASSLRGTSEVKIGTLHELDDLPASASTYARDVNTLLAVKAALGSAANPALRTWDPNAPLCEWAGVGWSHESSAPVDCMAETWSQSFTLATDTGAVATSVALASAGLTGTLSPRIAQLNQLARLDFSNNSLMGSIPGELGDSPSLAVVSLALNRLTGAIPPSLWNLCRGSKLTTLSLQSNNLTGSIPAPPGGPGTTCQAFTSLELSNNRLAGSIPAFLANFAALSRLDLSNNLFTYVIPTDLARLTNLSAGPDGFSVAHNHLMGPIPVFQQSFDAASFAGNSPLLCGPPLATPCVHTAATSDPTAAHPAVQRAGLGPTAIALVIAAAVLSVVGVAAACLGVPATYAVLVDKMHLLSRRALEDELATASQGTLVSFAGGGHLTEDALLNAVAELLETTSYGTIYRAWLPSKQIISLRLLEESTTKDEPVFLQAVQKLALAKHPNIVPLRAYYLSLKFEKLLICDHLPGKSLADILHGAGASKCTLDWRRRHKIAFGAARGLAHLHSELSTPLVHANLKASTILVDKDDNALLTGYGLHLLVAPAATKSVVVAAAEEGYKAPELEKLKKASMRTDVFSFGVLLLEILTGRKPGIVPDNDTYVDLPVVVKTAILEGKVCDVLDKELLKPSICTPTENGLLQALRLAMGCCAPSPSVRPTIREVVQKLEDIQSSFLTESIALNKFSCEL